jgi:tetratricopeptide (TPR) repeat protein
MKPSRRLSFFVIALVFSLGLVAVGAGAKDKQVEQEDPQKYGIGKVVAERLLEAYALLEAERYDEAMGIVDALAKRRKLADPEIAQIHRFRGYIFVSQDQGEKAVAEFEKSLAMNAMDPAAEQVMIYSLAQLYTGQGKFDKALALIDRWFEVEENPKADAWFLKAMIHVQQEDFAGAAEPASNAIALSTKPKESWLTLYGVVFSQLKDYPKVETALQQLVELAPSKSQYWVQLAAVQHHLGQDEKALATMELAHRAGLLKTNKEVRQLASLLFLRQQPFECAKVMEEAMTAGTVPADAEAYRLMANCLIAAREGEKALEPLAKGGELAPDGDMYLLLGQMYLQRDEHDKAIGAFEKALQKAKPEQRGSIHLMLGIAQLGVDHFAEAERFFHLAVDDSKVNRAAESYLKFLESKRAAQVQSRLAGAATGG